VLLSSHEVIGQILTNTTPESPPEWQTRYREYMTRLVEADVLWVILPTPPAQATGADRKRFEADLKILTSYLRRALALRPDDRPLALALILTKVDTLFSTLEAAQEELRDELLLKALSQLVTLAQMSDKICEAAILPTSSFGFGNAIRKPEPPTGPKVDGVQRHGAEEEPWVLRPDAHVVPFNLDALVAWTLFHGLAKKFVDADSERGQNLARVRKMLGQDLAQLNGWCVPVKTGRAA